MKEITIKIPDKKFSFFMELVRQLGIEVTKEDLVIPEEHQNLVLDRIKNTKEQDLLDWENVKDDFDGI